MLEKLGNWVVAARPERMAARDAFDREPSTSARAMSFERFDRVCGAARKIAARSRQQRRKRDLIPAHEQDEHVSHRSPYGNLEPSVTSAQIASTSASSAVRL